MKDESYETRSPRRAAYWTDRGGQDGEIPGALSLLLVALLPLAGSPQTGEPSGSDSDGAHVSTSTVLLKQWSTRTTAASHLVESVYRSAGEDHSRYTRSRVATSLGSLRLPGQKTIFAPRSAFTIVPVLPVTITIGHRSRREIDEVQRSRST